MKSGRVIIPLTGDPLHFGHLDVIQRAAEEFEEVVVAFGENPSKRPVFYLQERISMAKHLLANISNVKVVSFDGMLVDYAYENCIDSIIKGIRTGTDLDYEMVLDRVGESQELGVHTKLIVGKPEFQHISSTVVKAVTLASGMIHHYVPLHVKQRLEARLNHQYIVGITGETGSGKSYIAKELVTYGKKNGFEVHHIDLDKIAHTILGTSECPRHRKVRQDIYWTFGEQVGNEDGSIDTKALGEIVFSDPSKMKMLNKIMYHPIRVLFRKELLNKKGLIIVEGALIAEAEFNPFCNNNIILVDVSKADQTKRLQKRGLNSDQIDHRLKSQHSYTEKKRLLTDCIIEAGGHLWEVKSDSQLNIAALFAFVLSEVDIYCELSYVAFCVRHQITVLSYEQFLAKYNEKGRWHHTIEHIRMGLQELLTYPNVVDEEMLVAWLFHDYIYNFEDPSFNELCSANFLGNFLKKATGIDTDLSVLFLLSTKLNASPTVLSDIDLCIFGRSEFEDYCEQIRKEYRDVSDVVYTKGRTDILNSFLHREHIYSTDYFRNKYEKFARLNLKHEITRLKSEECEF